MVYLEEKNRGHFQPWWWHFNHEILLYFHVCDALGEILILWNFICCTAFITALTFRDETTDRPFLTSLLNSTMQMSATPSRTEENKPQTNPFHVSQCVSDPSFRKFGLFWWSSFVFQNLNKPDHSSTTMVNGMETTESFVIFLPQRSRNGWISKVNVVYVHRRVCSLNFTDMTQSWLYESVSIFLYFATIVKQVKALFFIRMWRQDLVLYQNRQYHKGFKL